jgi:hypothetical protein
MASPAKTPLTSLKRARRWVGLLARYNNGEHLTVSGQDALRALADRERQVR